MPAPLMPEAAETPSNRPLFTFAIWKYPPLVGVMIHKASLPPSKGSWIIGALLAVELPSTLNARLLAAF
jgi:hypothetical protein